jgi:hypothetical protein
LEGYGSGWQNPSETSCRYSRAAWKPMASATVKFAVCNRAPSDVGSIARQVSVASEIEWSSTNTSEVYF